MMIAITQNTHSPCTNKGSNTIVNVLVASIVSNRNVRSSGSLRNDVGSYNVCVDEESASICIHVDKW